MSFRIYQPIKGRLYAYEAVSYWDKDKRQPRQKRKYLGVVDPKTKKIRRPTDEGRQPIGAFDYGDVHFVRQCFEKIQLDKLLRSIFDRETAEILIPICISRIVCPVPMRRVKRWYERTYLFNTMNINSNQLSSQNLSRLLSYLGSADDLITCFFEKWIKRTVGGRLDIFYDITSLESYSTCNKLLEYGYSRSGVSLPQINFGIVINQKNSLPLYYKIFPGSLPDVVTLKNLIQEMKAFGREDLLLILDRGFYSQANIVELSVEKALFIIPLPFSTKLSQELISLHNKNIERPENVVMYKKHVLYIKSGETYIGDNKLSYIYYYDKERAVNETTEFYRRLIEVERRLNALTVPADANPYELVKEEGKGFEIYLEWKVEGGRIVVRKRKTNAITYALNRKGKMILITNAKLHWDEMLDYYRSKEDIETTIKNMKTDLEGLPLRTHNPETTKGHLLIVFLSAIVYAYIRNILRESKLHENHSIEDVIMELSKIRQVVLRNGKCLTTEITKKQRTIIEALKLPYET